MSAGAEGPRALDGVEPGAAMQLRVEKADGCTEVYLHTKVLGALSAALGEAGCFQMSCAEELAEAVTTYLRRRRERAVVSSDEIAGMITAALYDTGFEKAALAFQEHRVGRELRRRRVEVIPCEAVACEACFAEHGGCPQESAARSWDRSVLAREMEGRSLTHPEARALSGLVEEKVLSLGCRRVTTGLVRALVANELLAMRQAEAALLAEPGGEEKGAWVGERMGASSPEPVLVAAESGGS